MEDTDYTRFTYRWPEISEPQIDWEERRYELIKAMMWGVFCRNDIPTPEEVINYADALIARLKNTQL